MADSTITLRDFFGTPARESSRLEQLHSKALITEIHKHIDAEEGNVGWMPVWDSVVSHIDHLLEIDMAEIMLGAWKNYHDLAKYADAKRYPPDVSYLEPLPEHTITSRHKPELVVEIDHVIRKSIPFDISLQLMLKGFILEIIGGKIMKIHTGECRGNGVFKCLEVTLMEKELHSLTLPGVIDLGEGFPVS